MAAKQATMYNIESLCVRDNPTCTESTIVVHAVIGTAVS